VRLGRIVRTHVILQRKFVDHNFVAHGALEGPLLNRSVSFSMAEHISNAGQGLLTNVANGGLKR
jgi:hypothetical protein